jgi:hypothetical protein
MNQEILGKMWKSMSKGKNDGGKSERHFTSEGRKSKVLLEGSQALLARPSDRAGMRVKALGW